METAPNEVDEGIKRSISSISLTNNATNKAAIVLVRHLTVKRSTKHCCSFTRRDNCHMFQWNVLITAGVGWRQRYGSANECQEGGKHLSVVL